MLKPLLLAALFFIHGGGLAPAAAQEQRPRTVGRAAPVKGESRAGAPSGPEEVVRIRTRAVFLDVLVKDRKTNEPVRDLAATDFEVLDDGRRRAISYFTREGDSRRPLALLLFVDLWAMYGRSHLKSAGAMGRMADALSRLAPEDEVALMTTWVEEGPRAEPVPAVRMVSDFTRDRAETTAALLSIPDLVREQERLLEDISERRAHDAGDVRLDVEWKLSELADQVIPLAGRFPASQFVVVGLYDDLFGLRKGEREEVTERVLRAGIIFNALVYNKGFGTRLLIGTLNKVFMRPRGLSVHVADELAAQTGGEVARVGKPDDLGVGLSRFITSLTARYSLGFALGEAEPDDGRLRALTVKVTARDGRGRERKLLVRTRRGYYIPKVAPGTPAARP